MARSLGMWLVLAFRAAHAGPGADQDRALGESADPAMPVFELDWRNGLRGEAGARIPIVRASDRLGLAVELPAFIELHNVGPGPVPYEFWRGHIGVIVSDRWLAGRWTLRVHGAVEHESDHDIEAHWIYYEAVGAGLAATLDTAMVRWTLDGQARLLFETCTISLDCTGFDGRGDVSEQTTLTAVADVLPGRRDHPMVAVYLDATPGHRDVASEARLIVHAGYAFDAGDRGKWQVFAQLLAGREVGLDAVLGSQLLYGVGVRWEP